MVQFLLLSLCFGIPLLTFFISTGQYLGSGLCDMWRISPIFQVLEPLPHTLLLIITVSGSRGLADVGPGDGGYLQHGDFFLDVRLLQRQFRHGPPHLQMDAL